MYRRSISDDLKNQDKMTILQKTRLQGSRTGLFKKIIRFREAQVTYMPGLGQFHETDVSDFQTNAETICLLLPSDLDPSLRLKVCVPGLANIEDRVRFAEAKDALDGLRRHLRTRTLLNQAKIKHVTGQIPNTRARGIQDRFDIRVRQCRDRYRLSRSKLLALRGEGEWTSVLKELRDEDVRALNERERTQEETAEHRRLAEMAQLRGEADNDLDSDSYGVILEKVISSGESRRMLSWIWYSDCRVDVSDDVQMGEGKQQNTVHPLK